MVAVPLRADFDAHQLRLGAKKTKDGPQARRLTAAHRMALAAIVESGPIPAIHGVVRWRIIDLCQWLLDEHRVTVSKQTLSRELRAIGYRKLSARPRPACGGRNGRCYISRRRGAAVVFLVASHPV